MNINEPIQKGISQNTIDDIIDKTQNVVVKEFAEKLKKYSYTDNFFPDGKWHRYVFVDDIDKLLEELNK